MRSKILLIVSVLIGALGMMSCGSSSTPTTPTGGNNPYVNPMMNNSQICPNGQPYNPQYGCNQQQGMCPNGQPMYNGQCNGATSQTVCGGGQVYTTQYGCISQGTCPPGSGLPPNNQNNGQCIQGTVNGTNNGGCGAGNVYSQTWRTCLPIYTCNQGGGFYNNYCWM